MSLVKNLIPVTSSPIRAVISWDRYERIKRNHEIWSNTESIVHRLPEHFKKRYWENVLRAAKPVHYRPPTCRYSWDIKRLVMVENEDYPIVGIHPPEADQGLWGGETVVKGYIESNPFTKKKILPRQWIPHFFFPNLKYSVQYSEILDKYMKIVVTERTCRLIDAHFGLDLYLLATPEIDLASKLGNKLKRELMIALAKKDYYCDDAERHDYISRKYAKYVIPVEEAEWIELDLNEACRKLQDIEDSAAPVALKFQFEKDLVEKIVRGDDAVIEEEEYAPKKSESLFGEKLFGKFFKPLEKALKR